MGVGNHNVAAALVQPLDTFTPERRVDTVLERLTDKGRIVATAD